ncbi:hypothetical protein D1831_06205 [Lactiplantibacillus garii]|uniref:Uncharacterized protein n=1 Tax=Lactiplantibacillus garii TaxID=2306423 RepID=A0A3R8QRJ2_9LACO|nr:hypothetical protein [Lactiplantibacillus garii]RRK10652.1 hypothetical protein D1831_06205 [Lactiplantibacillus garii]
MMPVETKTKIHEDSKKLVYQDSDVKKAMDLIRDHGYVTRDDFNQMDDEDWAEGFEKKISDAFLKVDGEDPYIYFEQFDFKGGDIDSIIFDMDQVGTRDHALQLLAEAIHQKAY